jgi:hypothetical protein
MNFELSREFIDNLRMLIEANDEKQVAELLTLTMRHPKCLAKIFHRKETL